MGDLLSIEPDGLVRYRFIKHEMGQGVSTAMAMIIAEELCADWEKVIIDLPDTNLTRFQNDKNGDYLQLTGHASVVEDRARLEQLYTTLQRTWFPKGLDDPDITLVRFDADGGNYWDSHDSYVRLAVAFAKSIVTGEPGKSGNAGIARL